MQIHLCNITQIELLSIHLWIIISLFINFSLEYEMLISIQEIQ